MTKYITDSVNMGVDNLTMNNVKVTVMTANLRVNTPNDGDNAWPYRVKSMVDVIKHHRPWVTGTQEGLPTMLHDLLVHLPEYRTVGTSRERSPDGEHCAIFYQPSLVQLEQEGQFWLSETPDVPSSSWNTACPRICTWAIFQASQDPDVRFAVYNTHLDHVSQEARLNGIWLIWKHIQQCAREIQVPVILMGDLNAQPDNDVISFLRGQFTLKGETSTLVDASSILDKPIGITFHGFAGDTSGESSAMGESIDYIFATPSVSIHRIFVDRNRYQDKYPSDHFPVVVELEI